MRLDQKSKIGAGDKAAIARKKEEEFLRRQGPIRPGINQRQPQSSNGPKQATERRRELQSPGELPTAQTEMPNLVEYTNWTFSRPWAY